MSCKPTIFIRLCIIGYTLVQLNSAYAQPIYSNIRAIQRLTLSEGHNYIGVSLNTGQHNLPGFFGTNQLPAGADAGSATIVEEWLQDTQSLGEQYFLSNASGLEGWRANEFYDASAVTLDPAKGLRITIRPGQGPVSLLIYGTLASNEQTQVIAKDGYSLVHSSVPISIPLSDSKLVESGFTGAGNLVFSDWILFYNLSTKLFDQMVWYDTSTSSWRNPDATEATRQLPPGEAFVVWRKNRTTDLIWTHPIPNHLP